MIINFDRGYGQTPEQMIQSLMESTQMALDNSDRAATANHEMLQNSIAALEKKIGQGGGTGGSITTKQFSKSATVAAGGYAGVSYSATDIAIDGYTPIGLVGVSITGSNNTKINQYRWSAKSSDADYPYIGIQNYGSASATVTVTITVLYYNNDNVVYGERGPKGDTGAIGPRGLTGETGADGSNGVSCTHEWNGTTLTVTSASGTSSANLKGADGTNGSNGNDGARGASILAITTAPSSYSTAVGGVTPSYRISLATVTSQAGMAPNVGDQLRYSYYLYPVIYIDDNYVYCRARVSIRGANGTSATHSWDGTVLTVTSSSGTSSADLKGPQGIQGEPGVQGETGPAGTIAVNSVTTGEPGSNASVTNVGTTTAAQLDFVIPRGAKGEKGDRGDPGTIDETTRAAIVAEVKNGLFPIGYIYMSISDTDPSTMFGGEWTRIKDQFLLAAGDTYSAGNSGGSADAVAVEHTHTQEAHSHAPNDGHYFVSATASEANNTRVNYASSGSRYVDGGTSNMGFSHRVATDSKTPEINSAGEDGTGKNMPPYLTVYMWKRTA